MDINTEKNPLPDENRYTIRKTETTLTNKVLSPRRILGASLLLLAAILFIKAWPGINETLIAPLIPLSVRSAGLVKEAQASVTPIDGYQSNIMLGDSVIRLANAGVISRDKFTALYARKGGLNSDLETVLVATSSTPIHLTKENAQEYLELLWPLGLANYMKVNEDSPLNGPEGGNFASTGGWSLGNAPSGGVYFNKYRVVPLTASQEERVITLAKTMFRPCCGNSTFFQDCNHGSALLGLLELGVSEGLTDEQLYKEALAFNSFWFPSNYTEIALYFKVAKGISWRDIDPKEVMSKEYSSLNGWSAVDSVIRGKHLLPPGTSGASCSV